MFKVSAGDNLDLIVKNKNKKFTVNLNIEEIIDEGVYNLTVPSKYKKIYIEKGFDYNCVISNKNDKCEYKLEILEIEQHKKNRAIKVRIIPKIVKVQKREFFRKEVIIPLKFKLDANHKGEEVYIDATLKDISGGGMSFHSGIDVIIDADTKIKCLIEMEKELIVMICKLVKKIEISEESKFLYIVQFLSIMPGDQEKIVQYISKKQREF
jgi:c-di-GMP-binding flagellar brake protein YcgR